MDKIRGTINKYWQIIVTVALIIFNVGYTIAQLEEKPSREEVSKQIREAMEEQKKELRQMYIKIDQVPGLREKMESLETKIDDLIKRLDKIEDKLIYGYSNRNNQN